jgi:hypothetical protein
MVRRTLLYFLSVGAIALILLSASGEGPGPPTDPGAGFVERTAVELLLLEVEAKDGEGRPLRGLRPEDLVVKIDGRDWPIASVDDLCRCVAPGGPPVAPGGPPPVSGGPPPPAQEAPEAGRFVLYFDFGQLRQGGRHSAIEAAGRWLETVKGEADEVMIAAYVTRRGNLTLCDFTTDRARLTETLDRAYRDLALVDDWAVTLESRIDECERNPPTCIDYARQEYTHGRRSLAGLRGFLEILALQPGSKTVLYFHENGMMDPGDVYDGVDTQTQVGLVESIGAEATAARAVVHPLMAGMGPPTTAMEHETRSLAAVIAEATGGEYNRGPADFARVVEGVGHGCRCRYLIGLDPPLAESGRVFAVSVTARGVRLPHLYRVRRRFGADLWLRRASAILEEPSAVRDIPVRAAIVPRRVDRKVWDVAVQVGFDTPDLLAVPRGPRQEAGWEVGARLQRLDGGERWEMLGVSRGSMGGDGVPDATILHAREIKGLRPGRYRLTAFVRDRLASVFGGAEAVLELPDPRKGGVAGPVLMRADRPRVVSSLPLVKSAAATDPLGDFREGKADRGAAPAGSDPVRRGDGLMFETWVCPAGEGEHPVPARFISHDDVPVFRPGAPRVETIGPCLRILDDVATAPLEPGRYGYVVRRQAARTRAADDGVPFLVVDRPAGVP